MAVTIDQIRKVFSTYFTPDYTGQLDEKLIKKILKLYEEEKIGSNLIAERILKENKLNINQGVIGRILTRARNTNLVKTIPHTELKAIADQRIYESPADRAIHNTIREVREIDRTTTQTSALGKPLQKAPSWAKYKIVFATPQGKTTKVPKDLIGVQYFKTKAEADTALSKRLNADFKTAVDPEASKVKRQRTRTANVKAITKLSSEADKAAIKQIQGGISEINKYFKNKPELINTSNFGKNVKAMMALRLDKDTGKFYTRAKSNAYYLKKAKQGQLFDLFDINPVAGKKPGGRFPTNVNIAPGQFNRAFVGAQLTNFFKKGVNTETAGELDKILKKRNIRVDLPNVGKIGAAGTDVAFDTKTGSFPRIVKTLESMKAPNKILEIFNGKRLTNPQKIKTAVALGCVSAADGGRIGYALGSATINCVNTKLTKEPVQSSMKLRVTE